MRISTILALVLALTAHSCVSIEPDDEGRHFRQGTVTDGPRSHEFTIGVTTLDEVFERVGAPPDSFGETIDEPRESVAIWETTHLFSPAWTSEGLAVESREIDVHGVYDYYLECRFDVQGVLLSCTEGAPMPDPDDEFETCEEGCDG